MTSLDQIKWVLYTVIKRNTKKGGNMYKKTRKYKKSRKTKKGRKSRKYKR